MKNKKILLTAATVAILSLAACNRNVDNPDYINDNTDYINDNNGHDYTNDNLGYENMDDSLTDTHFDFVSGYGFENVVNDNGTGYYRRYRLDSNNAMDDDTFHSWRHTWVEPSEYIDREIDVYRYTGEIDGEQRTIHILSYNGKPIGGYHFGPGESAEQAVMIEHEGFFSRLADDFRVAWDDMFDIQR